MSHNRINWFRAWFNAMPEHWQRGLLEALRGGAFVGEIPRTSAGLDGPPDAVVFFVHPSLAEAAREAIERKAGER